MIATCVCVDSIVSHILLDAGILLIHISHPFGVLVSDNRWVDYEPAVHNDRVSRQGGIPHGKLAL